MSYDRFYNNQGASTCCWCKKNVKASNQEEELEGGFSSKLHAACDALGNPLRFFVTAGQRSDCAKALDLVDGRHMEALIADRGYDANYVIEAAKAVNAELVIPSRSNRKIPRKYDKALYKERNLIERMFNKIKHFRRVATRYDKLSITFYHLFILLEYTFGSNKCRHYLDLYSKIFYRKAQHKCRLYQMKLILQ